MNTASEGGLFPAQGHANYSASKAGVVGLTLELATELARYGATVNAVAMRARTRMTEDVEMFAKPASGPDPYDPAHAANLVRWLCGPDTDDVTGQVLLVVGRRVGVVGPLAVRGRVVLDHDWTVARPHDREGDALRRRGTGLARLRGSQLIVPGAVTMRLPPCTRRCP